MLTCFARSMKSARYPPQTPGDPSDRSNALNYSIEPLPRHSHHIPDMSLAFHKEWAHLIPGKSVSDVEQSLRSRTNVDRLPVAFIAVEESGDWIGAVSLKEQDLEGREDLSPWLSSLFVREAFRKHGIGASLVAHACAFAQGLGISELYLYTDRQELFYRKLGWTLVERRTHHPREISILRLGLT